MVDLHGRLRISVAYLAMANHKFELWTASVTRDYLTALLPLFIPCTFSAALGIAFVTASLWSLMNNAAHTGRRLVIDAVSAHRIDHKVIV